MHMTELALPAGLLRKLTLSFEELPSDRTDGENVVELLSDENIDRLMQGGGLRSLSLSRVQQAMAPAPSINFLCKFTSLTYLHTRISGSNCDNIAAILAYLPLLKALELEESSQRIADWGAVTRGIVSNRPELRHLALWTRSTTLLSGLVGSVFLQLEQLVSLEVTVTAWWRPPAQPHTWEWLGDLADKGRLEHLAVVSKGPYAAPHISVELTCRVIEKCKVTEFALCSITVPYIIIFSTCATCAAERGHLRGTNVLF